MESRILSSLSVGAYDGRYHRKTQELIPIASLYALNRNRLLVSAYHFYELIKMIGHDDIVNINKWFELIITPLQKSISDNAVIDTVSIMTDQCELLEKITNHDVTAVVRFLKQKYTELDIGPEIFNGYIHLGLTSQDINTTSIMLMMQQFKNDIWYVQYNNIKKALMTLATDAKISKNDYMLSLTHGQPATPTRLSWALEIFISRLDEINSLVTSIVDTTKFGGATGGMNAFNCLDLDINWNEYADKLCLKFGLKRNSKTSQVDSYDILVVNLQMMMSFNQILYDLCMDIWHYISRGVFILKLVDGEDGSSAMPNKINPIQFENAMGNISIANGLIITMAQTLPVSMMQRDLRDSTILRQLGNLFSGCLVAWINIGIGLERLDINYDKMKEEIDDNIIVVTEGIQTILRFCGNPNGYDKLKVLTRGKKITKDLLIEFIESLKLNEKDIELAYKGTKTVDDIKQKMINIVMYPENHFNIII